MHQYSVEIRTALPFLLIALAAGTSPAAAADYYVSPAAGADGTGTKDRPFRTVEEGQAAASPGDTVFIRGGTFTFSGT